MHLFFSVGEPSGDQHTAHLIHEIRNRRPDARFSAFGGPEMQAAGCELEVRLTDYAVMGIFSVLPLIFKFIQLLKQVDHFAAAGTIHDYRISRGSSAQIQ